MAKCAACEKEFENDRKLHAHLKAHKIRMVEYYQTYFPRHDLHDGNIIKFKNKNQYFTSDFNNKTNLRLWLKSRPINKAQEYCRNFLERRIEVKNIKYSPTQVELRSLMSPPIQYYNEIFKDYYKLCADLKLINKFEKFNEIISGQEYNKPEYKIYVDTREQRPLKFKRDIEIKTLQYGDYCFSSKTATCNCYIERKSLSDFIGTLSGGYERFCNEIKKAKEDNAYLIILVESKLSNALYFNYQFKSHNKERVFKKVKATPEFIFHNVRNLIQKFDHIQFLFVDGRREASRVVERIFTCGCAFEKIDLQLAYDLKKL